MYFCRVPLVFADDGVVNHQHEAAAIDKTGLQHNRPGRRVFVQRQCFLISALEKTRAVIAESEQ